MRSPVSLDQVRRKRASTARTIELTHYLMADPTYDSWLRHSWAAISQPKLLTAQERDNLQGLVIAGFTLGAIVGDRFARGLPHPRPRKAS
jgi:hypothetical protein